MSDPKTTSPAATSNTLFTFLALYFTTLFSLDTWAAARASPFSTPGNNYFRPAPTPPEPGSYQAGMHGRGNAGPAPRPKRMGDLGRVDGRAPLKMGTSCGGGC